MTKEESELRAAISKHLVAVYLNEEIGNSQSPGEHINVVIVEGNQSEGLGIVMSEPLTIEPTPRLVVCGDLAQWVPDQAGIGRIVTVVTPDFEVG